MNSDVSGYVAITYFLFLFGVLGVLGKPVTPVLLKVIRYTVTILFPFTVTELGAYPSRGLLLIGEVSGQSITCTLFLDSREALNLYILCMGMCK